MIVQESLVDGLLRGNEDKDWADPRISLGRCFEETVPRSLSSL